MSILLSLIAFILIAFSPVVAILALVFLFQWWDDNRLAKRQLEIHKNAVAEARTFDPEPIHQSAHFATDAELEAAGCFKPGIPLGYSQESGRLISIAEFVHRLIFGSTGSGKSTSALMTTLLTWAYSLIVIDSTGELAAMSAHHRQKYGKVLIVNSMGVFRNELKDFPQVGFNPLSRSWIDPNDPYTFDIRCQKTAGGIVRRDAMAREKYWADTARELATAAIMTACKYGQNANIGNVARVLRGDLTQYARDMVCAGIDTNDQWLIDTWLRWGKPGAEEIKSLNEVQENGRTEFWPFTIPPIAQCLARDEVDFRRCVHEPMTVYIVGSMETVKETGRFIRLATSHATAQIMSEWGAGSVPCMLMIDELFS